MVRGKKVEITMKKKSKLIALPDKHTSIKYGTYPKLKLPAEPWPRPYKPIKQDYLSIGNISSASIANAIVNDTLSSFMKRKLRDNLRWYESDTVKYHQELRNYRVSYNNWKIDCKKAKIKYKEDLKQWDIRSLENNIKCSENDLIADYKHIQKLKDKLRNKLVKNSKRK
jgi:hypothetical protein